MSDGTRQWAGAAGEPLVPRLQRIAHLGSEPRVAAAARGAILEIGRAVHQLRRAPGSQANATDRSLDRHPRRTGQSSRDCSGNLIAITTGARHIQDMRAIPIDAANTT